MNTGKPANTQVKVSLLLIPEELFRNYIVLQSIHIHKSPNGIDFQYNDLVRGEIDRHFSFLSSDTKNALLRFQSGAIEAEKQSIAQRFAAQRAGVSSKEFKQAAFLRHFHQLFQNLLSANQEFKCYHKAKKPGTDRYQTAPCTIRSADLRLSFNVIKKNDGLAIETFVINGASEPETLQSFNRNGFLLEKDQVYYIVSLRDFQTLQWLASLEEKAYSPETFSAEVLNRLEASYPVNRNGLLEEKEIRVAPTSRVMLSELNNAYLLLTPQWLYDDILIDGPFQENIEITIKGERVRIARDGVVEKEFLDLLAALHPNFENQRHKGYYYLSFADAQKKQWFSKSYHKLLDQNVEIAGIDMLRHFKYSQHKVSTTLTKNSEDVNRVYCTMTVAFGNESITLAQLQKAVYAGQHALMLKDGSLGILNDEWFDQYGRIIKHGHVRGSEISFSRFLGLPEAGAAQSPDVTTAIDREEWWKNWKRWQSGQEGMYQIPASVTASLRPYQQKGFDWLVLLSEIGAGGCLADDMGLGKTLQAICYIARYSEEFPESKHIIVCPTSLVYNWQQELEKFASHLDVEIFQPSTTPLEKSRVLITSYGLLRNNRSLLSSFDFGVAILDESHNIKNPEAQTTKAAHEIRAKFRLTLSGTPVINNTEDLFSQLEFSLPGLLGSREFFRREYAHPIDRHADPDKIFALQKLTAPFILRRTKKQVATDLPDKTQTILWCTMGAAQKTLYNNIRDRIKSELLGDIHLNGLGKSKLAVLQGLMKLRQICNDPRLLPIQEQESCRDSVKVGILMDELSNILGDHKVLVFSQFSSMLALLAQSASQKNIPYFLLDGKTPTEKRMEMVNAFQEGGDAPSLFFISLKAGNTGLTLTAADYVFLFDPWWNTAVEDQAVDRTYRIGQTRNVFAYKMICKDSIEERIIELQNKKKFVADELITADEGFVSGLTEADIMYLLQ